MAKDYTNNIGKLTDGPIPWLMMGPASAKPATAAKNAVYITTDTATGKWTVEWYENGWNQFTGVSM